MDTSVVSIQVGLPQKLESPEGGWETGFFKRPVDGPVLVTESGLAGDGQADLRFHGGIDKALLAYSIDHYPDWLEEFDFDMLEPGAFGENLSVVGLDEDSVCIGDEWKLGECVFQVSQPRQPCWKLSRRWNEPELPKRVIQSGRSGWYLRVLKPGSVSPGEMTLVNRPHADWTITRANQILYEKNGDPAIKAELAALPELSAAWAADLKQ